MKQNLFGTLECYLKRDILSRFSSFSSKSSFNANDCVWMCNTKSVETFFGRLLNWIRPLFAVQASFSFLFIQFIRLIKHSGVSFSLSLYPSLSFSNPSSLPFSLAPIKAWSYFDATFAYFSPFSLSCHLTFNYYITLCWTLLVAKITNTIYQAK